MRSRFNPLLKTTSKKPDFWKPGPALIAIDREVETKITFVKFHLTELLNIVHVQMQFFFAYFPISLLKFGKIVLFVTFTEKKWGFEEEEGGREKVSSLLCP